MSGCFYVLQCRLGSRGIGRIDQHGNAGSPRHQLSQQFQPLCRQLNYEKIDPRQVATRPGEARDKTMSDRVVPDDEHDGVAALAANAEAVPPVAAITATPRRTRSAARLGSRSNWLSAKR